MRFQSPLLLAMLIASAAAILHAGAAAAQEQAAPDRDSQGPPAGVDPGAAAGDAASDANGAEDESRANPSQTTSADVDAARVDESASVDGVPPWVFDIWCISEDARPQRGWGVSRDHSAGLRYDGRTHEGTWSVVSASPDHVVLAVNTDLGRAELDFARGNENDASRDRMFSAWRFYTHCGTINFNERF
jgi:hypothetical protein